ncbi:hypothetical protein GL218_03140 [Daldinia childiae]|uniref:uncharacterized protein n=1 Tax=Daldinia childiae TaxID=326645 RepID=UPI0014457711|nr:uncharacterized protein GL218_03140 [Daldinia childiae]KAF3060887.1 hypothetical protein GL218_03140 [Daldinia childiae]
MAQLIALDSSFHPGEQAVHKLLRVPHRENPTHHSLPPQLGYRVAISPLVAVGTLDRQGRPWASVWGGEKGFAQPVARSVLGVRATVGETWDPVVRELLAVEDGKGEVEEGNNGDGRQIVNDAVIKPEGGKLMAGLSIDPETRDRVKLAGVMAVGTATKTTPGVADLQLAFRVDEALGNCPKYINKKRISPRVPSPQLVSEGTGVPLPQAAIKLLDKADLFFIASKHGTKSMDVNIRGGPPGFVRVLRNRDESAGGAALVYPEYSGNRLYQTLGNIHNDPAVGIVVPDFETGDVLYLTGNAAILVGEVAAVVMPHAKLAIRVEVVEARFVREGLSFRGEVIDYSPYNPIVRRLACEKGSDDPAAGSSSDATATARLITRERLTPTISRYVFKLTASGAKDNTRKRLKAWHPGHHVTLDFSGELDMGYSHMRDEDPQSLNDDFVRTFTVSRPINIGVVDEEGYIKEDTEPELEITVRRHGPATALLERWNIRVPLEIPVMGFGGAEGFRLPTRSGKGDENISVFVAAGVGITPLMAQGASVLKATGEGNKLKLLWSMKGEDVPLAADVLEKISGLGHATKLFVTGKIGERERAIISTIRGLGAEVVERRIEAGDVLVEGEKGRRKYYLCAGPEMTRELLKWTEGEEVVYESFEY